MLSWRNSDSIFNAAVFQRWYTSLLTGYISTRIDRLSCFAAPVFQKPLKTLKILPALKHQCLKINSEMIWTSNSKSFRIAFSALCYKAARKAEPQFTTKPFSYQLINKKMLSCQELHILGSNTHMPDTISKIKIPFPTRKRKKKTKITIINISHFHSSHLFLQSSMCSGTPPFHKQLWNWKEHHKLGKKEQNMQAYAHPAPVPEHLWVTCHFTQFRILGLLKKHLAVQYADPFLT